MSGSGTPITLMGVDDHPLVAEGLVSYVLREAPGLVQHLGSATTWRALQELVETGPAPDVVIVDLHLGDGSTPGEVVGWLTEREIRSVVLTSELRPVPLREAIQAGASGVILKSDPTTRIIEVITAAAAGDFAVSSDLALILASDRGLIPRLAKRELEALRLLATGIPRKRIGKLMTPAVAESTVVTYFNRIAAKYRAIDRDVWSPQDSVRAAESDGYLDPPLPPERPAAPSRSRRQG